MKRHKVRLDAKHALDIVRGKPIALKIPAGCEVLEIHVERQKDDRQTSTSVERLADILFNGRPAR